MDRRANSHLGGQVPRHTPSHGLAWFELWPNMHQVNAMDISRPVVQVLTLAAKHAYAVLMRCLGRVSRCPGHGLVRRIWWSVVG